MSKALSRAGPLQPDIRLAQALSEFEASLTPDDKAKLRSSKSQQQHTPPTVDDVMRLTAEVDYRAKRHIGSGRCFGPRLTSMLHTVQQYVAWGDIIFGGSQSLIACGVWSVVRITILAATLSSSSMEKLSLLFMVVGRSAPRYQGLALLYARSRQIQDYLAEYMIIVVQMCHYFHEFSNRSTFRQMTSSFNESKIRNAEEELNRWAQLIKDEANFLLAQSSEHEAAENANVRSRLNRSIKSISRQQKIDERLQWLTALSTFDYESPWKQARKRGSSSFFVDIPGYKQWKQRQGPRSLLLSGRMGCGKSVVMANMVDDLSMSCPEDVVIYFFCRHDILESLSARTVFGSFAAQISQRHIGTDVLDEVFMNSVPSFMDLDQVLEIILTMTKRIKRVRLLLDGAAECPKQELDLIQKSLLKLSAECSILSCISCRDQADGLQANIWSAGQVTVMSIPDPNPDIAEFIEAELQRLMQSGKLSVGDPSLLITIRETLLRGADGMFLWVALQMETICAEKTDHLIRRALDNVPKSLSRAFRRILEESKQEGRCYQRDILKILVGAKRPLTVAEFREALSITPGDTSWDPRKMINDIHSTLACCGSLVTIDEEKGTVQLFHQSVAQFLHAVNPDSLEWSFTAQDADSHLGQITVTYLNYGIFDERVSARVIPQVNAGGAAGTIGTQTLSPLGTFGRKLADTVKKRQKPSSRDIGGPVSKIQSSETALEDFAFLEYSYENYLLHTSHMDYTPSPTIQLFRQLLSNPQFRPWSLERDKSDEPTLKQELMNSYALTNQYSRILHQFHTPSDIALQLRWAISHSHSLVLSMSLHDKSGMAALCSINSCLLYLMVTDSQLSITSHMCGKLLRITTLSRCNATTNWLITTNNYSLERYLELLKNSDGYDYSTFRWAVALDCFDDLHDVVEPLIEEAIAHEDLQTVKGLLRKGASPDTYVFEPPLQTAMRLSSTKPEYLIVVSQMLLTAEGWEVFRSSASNVDGFFSSLFRSAMPRTILNHAYERGDHQLVRLIWDGQGEANASDGNEEIEMPMFTSSTGNLRVFHPREEMQTDNGAFFSSRQEMTSFVPIGHIHLPQGPKSYLSNQVGIDQEDARVSLTEGTDSLRGFESEFPRDSENNNDEISSTGYNSSSGTIISQPSQDLEIDPEYLPTTDTPLLWDPESQIDSSHSMLKLRLQSGLALLQGAYESSYQAISDFIITLSNPKVPDGNIRISWRSARGKLMHIDLKTTDAEEARTIEARFQGSTSEAPFQALSSLAGEPESIGLQLVSSHDAPQDVALDHLPANSRVPIPNRLQDHSPISSHTSIQALIPPQSGVLRKQFLLLCYSVGNLHHLVQMEVTGYYRDRALFQAIRRELLALERKIHPAWYNKLPRKIRLLTLKHAGFVQFNVMFIGGHDRPEFVTSGYPPESEVDHNWDYDPCPRSASSFEISSAFIQTLLDPEHASSDRRAWYLLLPKKVDIRFDERLGGSRSAYGVQIKEGQNHFAIILAWLFVFLLSGIVGIICAIVLDPGSGFTIAAWIAVITGLALACLQLLPP